MKPTAVQPSAHKLQTALLLVLALSLTACASSSPPPQQTRMPARPPLQEPQPSQPYSESVRALLSKWADLLTPTPPTR